MKLKLIWHRISFFPGNHAGIKRYEQVYSRIGGCLNVIACHDAKALCKDSREYTQKKL